MTNLRFLILLFFGLQISLSVRADNPFLSDNAETLAPHQKYVVIYSTYNQFRFGKALQAPGLEFDFNVLPNLEVDTYTPIVSVMGVKSFPNYKVDGISGIRNLPSATGLGDIDIELKYRFIQETTYFPQVAFAPNFYLPTGNSQRQLGNGRFYYYPALTAQKTFSSWLLYGSAGYVVNGAPDLRNYYFGGLVLQKQLNEKIAFGTELFSQGKSGTYIHALTLLNLGTQYQITKDCTLYGSLGHSIVGENLLMGYFGIGWY